MNSAGTVLYAEDDDADAFFFELAFTERAPDVVVRRVTDGREALEYLTRQGAFADPNASPVPDVVVLDVSMPRCNGFDALAAIRSCAELAGMPAYLFSSSDRKEDLERAKALGATGYLIKPLDALQFRGVVDTLLTHVRR